MTPARFGQLMSGDTIDLDEASLVMAAILQPGLDEIEWLAELDLIAGECPTPTADGVARHLFQDLGFTGNREAYYDWRNSCLDRVIETRTGIPISLSILMIEVARRIGVSLQGVGMPAHFLVASNEPGVYYDPFHGGRRLDRDDARALFADVTRGQTPWRDEYLTPTPNRAIVIRMLNNLKGVFARRSDALRFGLVMQMRAHVPELVEIERDEITTALSVFN